MTIDHKQANNIHRRLERHRRQRLHNDEHSAGHIRALVENSHDRINSELEPRLIIPSKEGGTTTDDESAGRGGTGSTSSGGRFSGSGSEEEGGNTRTNESASSDSATSARSSATRASATSTSSSSTSSDTTSSSSTSSSSSSSSSSTSSSMRTSSTPTTTRSSTTRSSSTSEEEEPTSVFSVTDANSLATSVRVITQQPTRIASATATPSNTNDGPGAGPIIGIVAGALAGLVLVAAAVSYLVKWYSNKKSVDPYEANPFDRDEFRRQSVMIPEGFDSDDGHPSITEHHNYGASTYNDEMAMANSATGASLAGAAAAGSVAASHNDSGRPRPPTMFARHADAHAPSVGAAFAQPPVVPQLPQMAFGGGDPYSLAGVAGGMHNVSNPYAHLDRGNNYDQRFPAGHDDNRYKGFSYNNQGALERSGSDGSHGSGHGAPMSPGYASQQMYDRHDQQSTYETSGRPGTSEGRSGTPDIPNVQQTYALGTGSDNDHDSGSSSPGLGRNSGLDFYGNEHQQSGPRGSWSPPQLFSDQGRAQDDEYYQQTQQQYGNGSRPESFSAAQSLQVRNATGAPHANGQLLPNPHGQSAGARPISTASSMQDDDAAYGGVY
ncbi:unnamed protein product [Sympodiomycopsis kandeliae]